MLIQINIQVFLTKSLCFAIFFKLQVNLFFCTWFFILIRSIEQFNVVMIMINKQEMKQKPYCHVLLWFSHNFKLPCFSYYFVFQKLILKEFPESPIINIYSFILFFLLVFFIFFTQSFTWLFIIISELINLFFLFIWRHRSDDNLIVISITSVDWLRHVCVLNT